MTAHLSFPILVMRDDAKNTRARAELITDPLVKSQAQDRADQFDLAASILELYVELSPSHE